jgi:cation/acetate symporter
MEAISLGLALMFGTAGLPHILMRFYTVPDAKAARQSVFWATGLIGFFYLLTFLLGFGAMVLVGQETIKSVDAGGNMAALLLAEVLGGKALLGFIAAVAFATILAVVAGLTLSGAAALSHDLWVKVFRDDRASHKEQLQVARVASMVLGVLAIALGLIFKGRTSRSWWGWPSPSQRVAIFRHSSFRSSGVASRRQGPWPRSSPAR